MTKIWAIAVNTFKEAVRNRILYILLIFAVLLLLFSGMVRDLTIAAEDRVIRSLGLGAINLFGLMIAVFVGIGLVYNELEKKTIYTIVSKPIDRWQFILGKYFGLLLTIYVNILIMSLFFYFALCWQEFTGDEAAAAYFQAAGPEGPPGGYPGFLALGFAKSVAAAFKTLFFFPNEATRYLQVVILMTCLELAIVTAFAVLYSSFSTPTLSAILTVFTFIIGRGNEHIIRYSWYVKWQEGLDSVGSQTKFYVAQAVARIAPNLKRFYGETSTEALSGAALSVDYYDVVYAVAYCAVILTLAMLVFRRRNFK